MDVETLNNTTIKIFVSQLKKIKHFRGISHEQWTSNNETLLKILNKLKGELIDYHIDKDLYSLLKIVLLIGLSSLNKNEAILLALEILENLGPENLKDFFEFLFDNDEQIKINLSEFIIKKLLHQGEITCQIAMIKMMQVLFEGYGNSNTRQNPMGLLWFKDDTSHRLFQKIIMNDTCFREKYIRKFLHHFNHIHEEERTVFSFEVIKLTLGDIILRSYGEERYCIWLYYNHKNRHTQIECSTTEMYEQKSVFYFTKDTITDLTLKEYSASSLLILTSKYHIRDCLGGIPEQNSLKMYLEIPSNCNIQKILKFMRKPALPKAGTSRKVSRKGRTQTVTKNIQKSRKPRTQTSETIQNLTNLEKPKTAQNLQTQPRLPKPISSGSFLNKKPNQLLTPRNDSNSNHELDQSAATSAMEKSTLKRKKFETNHLITPINDSDSDHELDQSAATSAMKKSTLKRKKFETNLLITPKNDSDSDHFEAEKLRLLDDYFEEEVYDDLQLAPITPDNLQLAPITPDNLQLAPITPDNLQLAPITPDNLQLAPITPDNLQLAPITPDNLQLAPITPDNLQLAPITPDNLQLAPITPDNLQLAPITSDNLQLAPITPDNLQLAPITSDNLQLEPITSDNLELEPITSGDLELEPITSGDLELEPITFDDLELAPTTFDDLELAPITSDDLELEPTTFDDLQLAPITSDDLQLAPITSDDLELAPITSDDLELAPITSDDLELAPITSDDLQLAPTTSDDHELAPKMSDDHKLELITPDDTMEVLKTSDDLEKATKKSDFPKEDPKEANSPKKFSEKPKFSKETIEGSEVPTKTPKKSEKAKMSDNPKISVDLSIGTTSDTRSSITKSYNENSYDSEYKKLIEERDQSITSKKSRLVKTEVKFLSQVDNLQSLALKEKDTNIKKLREKRCAEAKIFFVELNKNWKREFEDFKTERESQFNEDLAKLKMKYSQFH